MRNLKLFTISLCTFLFGISFYLQRKADAREMSYEKGEVVSSPPCVQLFYAIEKYADMYKIPKNYAYGVAYRETRYTGPFHWDYDHAQISSASAVGPMQVMPATARGLFPDRKFDSEYLRTDIDFNVHCSMKLLRRLYDKHKNWKVVFGAYNTGKPIVNSYAEAVYAFRREL